MRHLDGFIKRNFGIPLSFLNYFTFGPKFSFRERRLKKRGKPVKCLKFLLLFNLPTPPMSLDTFLFNSVSRQTHWASNKLFTFPGRLLWMISSPQFLVTGSSVTRRTITHPRYQSVPFMSGRSRCHRWIFVFQFAFRKRSS